METINSILLASLQNAEFIQYNDDVISIIPGAVAKALGIEQPYITYNQRHVEMGIIYKRSTGSPLTSELVEVDERRDDGTLGLYYIALGNSYSRDPVKRHHAELLLDSMKVYGAGITRMNFPKETAVLNNLYVDWTTNPDLIAAVANLDLLDWVKEIKASNDAFNTLYLDRTKQTGSTADFDNLKTKRLEVAQDWYDLRDALLARYTSKKLDKGDTSDYITLFNSLNALIDKYNTIITDRKAKAAKTKAANSSSSTSNTNTTPNK